MRYILTKMTDNEPFTPSENSLQFPQRSSGISRLPLSSSEQFSLFSNLDPELPNTSQQNTSNYSTNLSRRRAELFRSQRSTLKFNRSALKKGKRRRKKKRMRREKKQKESKKLTDLNNQNSDFTEIGNLAMQNLLNKGLGGQLNQIPSCGESGSELDVIYQNEVENVQQQVKVSNVNCSCRVF